MNKYSLYINPNQPMDWLLLFGWRKKDKHTPHQILCSCSSSMTHMLGRLPV